MSTSITYVITTNKNIRCYGCSENCEKFQVEKYVDLETFRNHMKILKNIFTDNFELHFGGGEPLLHKQLEQICEIAREELPNTNIYIHTNGILMNTLKDNQLINLSKNNITFSFYLYPIISYLKNYEKQVKRFEKLNINMYWTHEHIYFNKFTLKRYQNKCSDTIMNKGQLLIVDNKLYALCPSIQCVQYKLIDMENNYYIEMDKIKNLNQINRLFIQDNCSNCKNNSIPISNLYINNYDKYKQLIDYVYDLGAFLQIPFFYKNIQDSTSPKEFSAILNRYVNGQLDIYIPFFKNSLTEEEILNLKNLLFQQKDIEKFNLYFVSIDDDKDTQQKWFEIFESSQLNTYFLKGKSLYLGEKTFFDNSRIINHYILDITKLEDLKDSLFLSNRKQEINEIRRNNNFN